MSGEFSFVREGVEYNYIMRWDGTDWHPLGDGMDGPVHTLRVFDDGLYAAGWFSFADTVSANGLARWDGTQWHSVNDLPPFYIGGGPNLIQDVIEFQGEIYVGGNLPLVDDLAKWNGAEWVEVGGGFVSAFSRINHMEVHGDRLYIGGAFAQCPPLGNDADPGNGIVAWDGQVWDDLAGGTCGSDNGAIGDFHWWGDTLFAVGLFNRIGGVEGDRIAKWHDGRWCTLNPPEYWGGNLLAIQDFRDSLYIGGSFFTAGADSMSSFVRWIGGSYTYECGIPQAILDGAASPALVAFPNPATSLITLQGLPPTATTIALLDLLGRRVLQVSARPTGLNIAPLPSGSYVVQVLDAHAVPVAIGRFMKL
ncbi:MAG: T9SS type A sorting domain-containing protein [Flavobacteriales bacterium]